MTNLNLKGGEARIALPWPHKDLSPNARVHWATRARLTKIARGASYWLALEATGNRRPRWEAAKLDVVFCPPDNRRRDRDNLIASLKATNDGIADALGIDDHRFVSTYTIGAPVKGGAVYVTIGEAS